MSLTPRHEPPRHYPLNGLDLSLSRYHHRPLDGVDVIANRLMTRWLSPTHHPDSPSTPLHNTLELPLIFPNTLHAETPTNPVFHTIPYPQRRPSYHLRTHHIARRNDDLPANTHVLLLSQATHSGGHPCLPRSPPDLISARAVVLAALRRHAFETSHPELPRWLAFHPRGHRNPEGLHLLSGCCPRHAYGLDAGEPLPWREFVSDATARDWPLWNTAHLGGAYAASACGPNERLLFPGNAPLQDARRRLGPRLWAPGPMGIAPPVPGVMSGLVTPLGAGKVSEAHLPVEPGDHTTRQRVLTTPYYPYSTTLRTRRSRSEPAPGAYIYTTVPDAYVRSWRSFYLRPPYRPFTQDMAREPELSLRTQFSMEQALIPLYIPCMRVSEVEHRLRRRSLSRRHVARMFPVPSNRGGCLLDTAAMPEPRALPLRCGWCNSEQHAAEKCPVPAPSRCKCTPFPVYHTAKICPVPCSRPCGNPLPRNHRQHRNAMTCRYRCCMCGIRGHSGKDCRLKTCRCGGQHLGQDCGWKPTCRVSGCGRYLCGVHCWECGSTEKPFVGWRCGACLGNGEPVREKVEPRVKRRRGRRKERKGVDEKVKGGEKIAMESKADRGHRRIAA